MYACEHTRLSHAQPFQNCPASFKAVQTVSKWLDSFKSVLKIYTSRMLGIMGKQEWASCWIVRVKSWEADVWTHAQYVYARHDSHYLPIPGIFCVPNNVLIFSIFSVVTFFVYLLLCGRTTTSENAEIEAKLKSTET